MSPQESREVGRVAAIWRYPVKSMAGECLERAHLGWQGFDADRRYAFMRASDRSGLPWLSARSVPELVLFEPRIQDPTRRDPDVVVRTPEGTVLPLRSTELLERIQSSAGEPLQLMHLWRGTYDSMPVSLISTGSIGSLSAASGGTLAPERFRPNVLVESTEQRAYPEDKWVGKLLLFGDGPDPPRIRVNRRDLRCSIVNLDPKTGHEDRAVLREIVKSRKNLLGVYGSPERTGAIAVGDMVRLRRS